MVILEGSKPPKRPFLEVQNPQKGPFWGFWELGPSQRVRDAGAATCGTRRRTRHGVPRQRRQKEERAGAQLAAQALHTTGREGLEIPNIPHTACLSVAASPLLRRGCLRGRDSPSPSICFFRRARSEPRRRAQCWPPAALCLDPISTFFW
mgnify:CR=1 FL=1